MSKELRAALPIVDPASYTIAGEFAKGGFGRLLRARDLRLHREVALKELFQPTEEAEERFIREALVAARLQHPSIVPVHEVGRWPTGELFYAMKLVSGRGLDELIAEAKALPQRLALVPHVLAVAEAIAYAHSERIIHRDLKPANILVGAFGETVVIDWGLAKDMSDAAPASEARLESAAAAAAEPPKIHEGSAPNITLAGAVLGTPAYMSPEQAMSRPVDQTTDVYALGAILYHVLAGAPPHEGETAYEVIVKKLSAASPPDLEARQPGVPPELATIVKKAMARAPEDRYPTAQELARDLRAFQTGQIVRAHKYSWSARALRFARRYRAVLAVATVALVVLAAAFVIFVQRIRAERDNARRERDRAEHERATAESARREADERADELTLLQARRARDADPNATLTWLKKLSPAFTRWGAVRIAAADARSQGIARILTGHSAGINDVDISPDGKTIVFASDDRRASLWDLATGGVRFLSGHTDEVWSVTFSPDGRRLATGSKDGTVRIWEVATGEARVLGGDREPVWQSSFLGDGARLISFSNRGTGRGAVFLWDLASGEGQKLEAAAEALGLPVPAGATFVPWTARGELVLWDLARGEARRFPGQSEPAAIIVTSPDGTRVATADNTGKVRLWAVKDGSMKVLPGSPVTTDGFVFSPDGQKLAAGTAGGALRIWDVTTGQGRDLRGHDANIRSLRFSPRGDRIATASIDRTVRLWTLETGESRTFRGFTDAPTSILFSKDGGLLVAGGWDHTARVWDLKKMDGDVIARHEGGASALTFFRDGRCVASAGRDGVIRTTPVAMPPAECGQLAEKPGHEGPIAALAAWPRGGRIVSAGQDGTVRLHDVDGGDPVVLRGHEGSVLGLALSPDGKLFASGGKDGTVRLWDVEQRAGSVVMRHQGAAAHVAFSPSGGLLASAGEDNAVRLWDIAKGTSREVHPSDTPTFAIAFSPDGAALAFTDDRHNVFAWSLAGDEVRTMTLPRSIRQMAFLPGGDAFVTVPAKDVVLRVVDTKNGAIRHMLRGHLADVRVFALSPDGRRIASADKEGSVRLWDLESGESRMLAGHTKEVVSVTFSPDGRVVVTASADGTVRRFWDDLPLEPEALRAWIDGAAPASAAPR